MKSSLLLPNKFKLVGWVLFIPSIIVGVYVLASGVEFSFLETKVFSFFPTFQQKEPKALAFVTTNLTYTLIGLTVIISSLMIGFSKEKNEDEYISRLRLSALLWAVLLNYILLFVAFIFVYDLAFLSVMTYNMFTVLLLFIFRFHYLLIRSKAAISNEK